MGVLMQPWQWRGARAMPGIQRIRQDPCLLEVIDMLQAVNNQFSGGKVAAVQFRA